VSIGGLGLLAAVMGAPELDLVRAAYNSDQDRAGEIEAMMIDPDDADGLLVLRMLAAMREVPPSDPSATPEIGAYLSRVAQQYGKLFSVGITALLDALDVDHVALCGTIPELLQGNHDFFRALKAGVAGAAMGQGTTGLTVGNMREWGWRGAALLSRDPGFLARRFPAEVVVGSSTSAPAWTG
jgi:hypothetical protein